MGGLPVKGGGMWHVTVNQQLTCTGCGHEIQEGERCLSDLPEQLPKGIAREEYRHFHFHPFRPATGEASRSCYQMFTSSQNAERTEGKRICLDCGTAVVEGEYVFHDYFYVRRSDDGRADSLEMSQGLAALLKSKQDTPASFTRFGNKFIRAGLGNGRGSRSLPAAEEFYRASVPGPVRNLGEGAVKQFTEGKHASHIQSVANAPGKAKSSQNIIWELAKGNLERGSRDMTRKELFGIQAKNAVHASGIVGRTAALNAGRGAGWGALFELPVSIAENVICFTKGKKTREEAVKDAAKSTLTAGVTGGAMAAGITGAVALGAGPVLAAAAPVLAPVGIGIFAVSTGSRILRAWKSDLIRVDLCFHQGCYDSFANQVSSYPADGTPVNVVAAWIEQRTQQLRQMDANRG